MDFPEPPYSFHHDPDDMELNSTAATRGSVTPPYSLVTPGDRTPPENRLEVSFSGAQSSVGSDKLRRQSSGSSFQSKSDVDSEWLREDVTLGTEAAAQRVEVIPPISVDESTLPSSSTIKPLTVQLKDLSGSQSPTHMKPHADDAEKTPVAVFSSMDAEPEGSPLARQSLGRLSFGLLGGETLLASKSKATGESAEITGFDSPDAGASQQLIVVRTTSGHSKSVGGTPDNVADKMRAGGAIPKVFAGSSGPFINGHGKRISGTPKLRVI